MITYEDFITRIVDDGIEAATADYKQGKKLAGAVAGFEACRSKSPEHLHDVLADARRHVRDHFDEATLDGEDDYWYWRSYELEVEWVMNCVSAVLMNEGRRPLMDYLPTTRGVFKAAEVLGIGAVQ